MRFYASTPIIQTALKTLKSTTSIISKSLAIADQYIVSSPRLRKMFGSRLDGELQKIAPFLNQSLIEKMMVRTLEDERMKAELPSATSPSNEAKGAPAFTYEELNKIGRLTLKPVTKITNKSTGLHSEMLFAIANGKESDKFHETASMKAAQNYVEELNEEFAKKSDYKFHMTDEILELARKLEKK